VGCQVRFTVQKIWLDHTLARIFRRGRVLDHKNHGPALPSGSSTHLQCQARFSKGLLNFIDLRLRQGVKPREILNEHQEFVFQKVGHDGVFEPPDIPGLIKDDLLNLQAIRNRHASFPAHASNHATPLPPSFYSP